MFQSYGKWSFEKSYEIHDTQNKVEPLQSVMYHLQVEVPFTNSQILIREGFNKKKHSFYGIFHNR